MNLRRGNSLAGSPLLIGAITTLIIVVAVFLSYNANNGLPFVPTYNIKVALPETSGLQATNQVRIAGTRVGIVSSLSPHEDPATGRVTAIADLKLEKKVQPLPADTKAIVQSVSAVGPEVPGTGKGLLLTDAEGGRDDPGLADARTSRHRPALQHVRPEDANRDPENTINFGDGLAERGLGLNNTIATLRPLVINAIPVLHNLASPKTGLGELFVALDRVASQTAPVANAGQRERVQRPGHVLHRLRERRSLARTGDRGRSGIVTRGDLLVRLPGALGRKDDRVHAPIAPDRSALRTPRSRSATPSPWARSTCAPPPP